MPSKSQAQYKIMGMAYALKSGKMSKSDFKNNDLFNKIKKIADKMTLQQLKDFVDTPPKPKDLPKKVKKESLDIFIKNTIKEEIKKYLYETIAIKNNIDKIEILFLKGAIKDIDMLKNIIKMLKLYRGIKNMEKNKNGIEFELKDNISTTDFLKFVLMIKNKLGLNIKRENKNVFIIGLD